MKSLMEVVGVGNREKKEYHMDEQLKVLAVVCHPADAIDGAGGTLCLHVERGDEVTVVVCTHGVDTHDLRRNDIIRFGGKATPSDPTTAIGRKEQEVVNGMAILGVKDVRFLRFPDELLTVSTELIEALSGIMADVQPHLLIVHNPTEEGGLADVGHADSAIATLKARYLANTPRFLKKPPGRIFPAQVFLMTMNGQTTQLTAEGTRHGTVLIDVTSVIDRKVRAMDCLRSQYYPGHLGRKCIEVVNGRMGLHWCVPYAEAFQTLFPHVYSHLPVNEHLMKLAGTPASEHYKDLRIMVNDVPFLADA
jgi:LmbE family N-acetylglucosaminyl deacetylase